MTPDLTLASLLAQADGNATAVRAPGRDPLTFAGLRQLVAEAGNDLHRLGIGRGDRVAIVLPNGPEMAPAFLAFGSWASAATSQPCLSPAGVRVLPVRPRHLGTRRCRRLRLRGDRSSSRSRDKHSLRGYRPGAPSRAVDNRYKRERRLRGPVTPSRPGPTTRPSSSTRRAPPPVPRSFPSSTATYAHRPTTSPTHSTSRRRIEA